MSFHKEYFGFFNDLQEIHELLFKKREQFYFKYLNMNSLTEFQKIKLIFHSKASIFQAQVTM